MAIETKYNIGQEVWYRVVGNAVKGKVIAIERGLYRCTFYMTTAHFREEELFPTKEELLKSL